LISKKLLIPVRLLADQALLEHLPSGHPARAQIEDDLDKRNSGWIGEQNLAYYLDMFQIADFHVFYGLHLDDCQIDVLILTPTFISLIEVKNYSGILIFTSESGQVIRRMGDHRDGFPNPPLQVGRHRELLRRWLTANGLPAIPIEADVVISNPSTIIENPTHSRRVQNHAFHAEQAPLKIQAMLEKHSGDRRYTPFLQQIETQLSQAHADPFANVLNTFNISPSELLRGVRCTRCRNYDMRRIYANWHCPHCGHKSKTAHESMILHYYLLLGQTMTNKQCREFLKLENAKLITDLLNKMNLQRAGTGKGSGLYYVSPSHEILHNHLSDRLKEYKRNRIFKRKS
jgi:hypothetical protein